MLLLALIDKQIETFPLIQPWPPEKLKLQSSVTVTDPLILESGWHPAHGQYSLPLKLQAMAEQAWDYIEVSEGQALG